MVYVYTDYFKVVIYISYIVALHSNLLASFISHEFYC